MTDFEYHRLFTLALPTELPVDL